MQWTHNIMLRRVHEIIVAVESNKHCIFLVVRACVRFLGRVGLCL